MAPELRVTLRAQSLGVCSTKPDQQSVQLETKVCIQAYASLYIAVQVSIPSCHHIMTQYASGDHTMKFE